ncbi:MAG: glycoside hydrolase family 9 protein [Bacteroidales bacterium]|nr:glycoside hydrolase family 9 protein [Bacteroidales bacterium]
MIRKIVLFTLASYCLGQLMAQTTTADIRLNQLGYLPNSIKVAAIINPDAESFRVMSVDMITEVFEGTCLPSQYYPSSGENVRIADFSILQTPGDYVIVVDGLGKSYPFTIRDDVFTALSKSSIKSFYYNRASMDILEEYAGIYARPMGHPDTAVVVLPSAASEGRPAGTVISTPKGWYDAGDYNKYVVNSGISTFTLLSAYETYPEYFDTLDLNIPESGNAIPDILDEALWNIRWLMTMQDTADGGVYFKTTEAQFSTFAMPASVTSTRYVTAKSTSATLDFAALMAMTARIYKAYLPDMADSVLEQSLKAWQWAIDHPNVPFYNPAASGAYPAVGTGGYGDTDFDDEFAWCAAELYITTGESAYYDEFQLDDSYSLPGWGGVKTLGLLSLIVNRASLTEAADTTMAIDKLLSMVTNPQSNIVTSPYRIPGDFFYWGGNNGYANWGMLFMHAFKLTGNANYFNAALASLDYLLGRNATKYCFVTGTGTKTPMYPHHRISGADGIAAPIPGMLVGGPGTGSVDDCGASQYPSTFPARSYVDLQCSYSTNEVAINWNAPLAFLAGAVVAEYQNNYTDTMPVYFLISGSRVELSYKKGNDYQLVIQGNTNWSLSPNADWIILSATSGTGTGTVLINSDGDNPTDTTRSGMIYVYSQEILTDSIEVLQNGIRKSFRIEAEDYFEMSGIQTETTTDEGGGLNIGYVDPTDWAAYNIDITNEGVYDVVFRHAGYAGNFDVSLDGTYLQTITFAATSDWQDWDSYSTEIGLTEGQHELKLTFNAAGTNLNWMQFDWNRPLSIDNFTDNTVSVYPVPADNSLNIVFANATSPKDIRIISLDGKTMVHKTHSGSSTFSLDISGWGAGLYILRIDTGDGLYTKKIIVE